MTSALEAAPCRWCGERHGPRCPWVKSFSFDDYSGLIITKVEFFAPSEYLPPPKPEKPEQPDYERLPRSG